MYDSNYARHMKNCFCSLKLRRARLILSDLHKLMSMWVAYIFLEYRIIKSIIIEFD